LTSESQCQTTLQAVKLLLEVVKLHLFRLHPQLVRQPNHTVLLLEVLVDSYLVYTKVNSNMVKATVLETTGVEDLDQSIHRATQLPMEEVRYPVELENSLRLKSVKRNKLEDWPKLKLKSLLSKLRCQAIALLVNQWPCISNRPIIVL